MALVEEKLPAVDTSFIGRTMIGPTAGNLFKGVLFGNAVAISQAATSAWRESYTSSRAAGKAIDIPAFKSLTVSKLVTFWPTIVA